MNKYLESAVERYPQKEALIHPISEQDAGVIETLMYILKKAGVVGIDEIMLEYKYEKDKVVLKELKAFAKNSKKTLVGVERKSLDGKEPTKEEAVLLRYMIIAGRRIDLFHVIGYDSVDLEDLEEGTISPSIVLNPTPEGAKAIPFYANEVIEFESEESRESHLAVLDNYLRNMRGGFLNDFVGNEDEKK